MYVYNSYKSRGEFSQLKMFNLKTHKNNLKQSILLELKTLSYDLYAFLTIDN